ncbi:hypothetical protein Golob_024127, partial [Gossypium lobatum]|nr:hypothetical protein [Gossypium lobatum]
VTQNNLQDLKEIWDQWDDETKQLFYRDYGDSPYLLDVKRIQAEKANFRAVNIPTLLKRLMSITRMSEQWKRVDVFALSIYRLVMFPKVLGHIDEAVSDLFDWIWGAVGYALLLVLRQYRS